MRKVTNKEQSSRARRCRRALTECTTQYDDTLATVKIQMDIMVNNNNSLHAWVNEVQTYLNRARINAADNIDNQDQGPYDE